MTRQSARTKYSGVWLLALWHSWSALNFSLLMATLSGFDSREKVLQMSDPVTVELLGKLKIMAEKSGVEFDSNRMTSDMDYAYQTLMELGSTHDQIQGLVVMQMLKHLGLLDLSDGMSE
jgi:hypothetical protein